MLLPFREMNSAEVTDYVFYKIDLNESISVEFSLLLFLIQYFILHDYQVNC